MRLRPVTPADVPALGAIRAEPGVRRWWGEPHPDDFETPTDGAQLAIEVGGTLAGLIQFEEVADPQYRSAASASSWAPSGKDVGTAARPSACSSRI